MTIAYPKILIVSVGHVLLDHCLLEYMSSTSLLSQFSLTGKTAVGKYSYFYELCPQAT